MGYGDYPLLLAIFLIASFWQAENTTITCFSFSVAQFHVIFFSDLSKSAICCRVFPSSRSMIISDSNFLMFVHFLLLIKIPPDVVLLFSYIRGLFVYCPFLLIRFTLPGVPIYICLDRAESPKWSTRGNLPPLCKAISRRETRPGQAFSTSVHCFLA